MALDPSKLREGIDDYRRTLAAQNEELSADFAGLQELFELLWTEYGGARAEELREHWRHTAEWFQGYLETTRRLDHFLQARGDELRPL